MRFGARFLDPSPGSVDLVRACAEMISVDADDLSGWYRYYVGGQSERIAVDVDIIKAFVEPGAAVLEIGAVPLILTLALARQGFRVGAVDVDPSRFAQTISDHQLSVAACDIETEALPFEDGSFDALILNEVLEHLRINPVFTLREARRVLRPGGTLLLSTPNLRSVNGLWNLVVRGRSYAQAHSVFDEYQKLEYLGHMGHVREYAPGDVTALLGRLDFVVTDLVYRSRQHRAAAEAICRVIPQLRRSVSYVARAA
jgi:2-polyprenyl-3-methyl-5-hydroxy-6-metoxy-1,4-benzoquinol methylase